MFLWKCFIFVSVAFSFAYFVKYQRISLWLIGRREERSVFAHRELLSTEFFEAEENLIFFFSLPFCLCWRD